MCARVRVRVAASPSKNSERFHPPGGSREPLTSASLTRGGSCSPISAGVDGFGCLAFHVSRAVCYVVLCVWPRSVNGMPVSFTHVIIFNI